MGEFQEILFTGGLNQDDEDRFLQPNDRRFSLNVRGGSSDQDNVGSIENTKGNVLVSFTLPSGTNECVGTHWDREFNTVFYWVKNSNGDHSILRYFPNDGGNGFVKKISEDQIYGFDSNTKITHADFIDDKLYWTDVIEIDDKLVGQPPRKINTEKARFDKKIEVNLYFGLVNQGTVFPDGDVYTLSANDENGSPVFSPEAFYTANSVENDLEAGSQGIADAINQNTTINPHFTAEACGGFVTLTGVNEGYFDVSVSATTQSVIAVNQNMYERNLIEENIDRVKYPPSCEPSVEFGFDDSRNVSYLDRKVFQFRARYIFDDDEKSVFGPISVIPLDIAQCTGNVTSENNFIDVDFTDPRLNNRASLTGIKQVEIAVREGNNAKFKSVVTLEQDEFGIGANVYRFFNDGSYPVISDAESNQAEDAVPLLSKAQAFLKNRLFDGDILEGYDQVCVDADLSTKYNESVSLDTFSISGKIFIRNPFSNNASYKLHQPIHNLDDGGGAVFGGLSPVDIRLDTGSAYQQTLELEGFVVYLAGTDYYGISRQRFGNNSDIQNSNGVYNSSSGGGKRGKIRDEITGSSGGGSGENPDTRVWSDWKINNVPPGKYILRVASHFTTASDLSDPGRGYQDTSTYVSKINFVDIREVEITISNGNVSVGPIEILDLTDTRIGTVSRAVSGYVTDADLPVTPANVIADTKIELAGVNFNRENSDYNDIVTSSSLLGRWILGGTGLQMITDHNGFFFWSFAAILPGSVSVDDAKSMDLSLGPITLYDSAGAAIVNPVLSSNGAVEIYIRNGNGTITADRRTKLDGRVIDSSGNGVSGISIVCTEGDVQETDQSGFFETIIYGRTLGATGIGTDRDGKVIYGSEDPTCVIQFLPIEESFVVPLGNTVTTPPPYDIDNLFALQDVIATITGLAANNALKRGYDGQFGIEYSDRAGRRTTVNTDEDLKLHISFYTEVDPATGLINPGGIPEVSWTIKHLPPDFATHYQWVRTRNNALNFYLQFAAKAIAYIDDSGGASTFSNGTQVKINIENIVDYKTKFPNSVLGYTFTEGDRIRFIQDEGGNFFNEYFDFEVLKQVGDEIFMFNSFELGELKEGTLFEIYSPKLQTEENVFYEIGECFEIGESGGVKFHKGPTSDQNPLDPFNVPATGTFETGDAYYRQRSIPLSSGSKGYFVDSELVSDFFESREESIGRPNVVDTTKVQIRRKSLVRYSNVYLPETKINGLSTFQPLSENLLPREYGAIYKLQVAENVLLAIHEFRWVAIYVQEKLITNQLGEDEIILTDDVIGSFRAMRGRVGTKNPESVVEYKGTVFAWDVNKGVVMRYASNGLLPVSSYKMSKFFTDKSKERLKAPANTKIDAVGVYDPDFDYYVLTFKEVSYLTVGQVPVPVIIPAETIAFFNGANRWISFYSFTPESYSTIGQDIISFVNGELWLHNANSVYNNFYGVQYTSQVRIIPNAVPGKVKTWLALWLETAQDWFAPDMEIPADNLHPNGMKSRLIKTKFRRKESFTYAGFMRDQNTPNAATIEDGLINGRRLKGNVLEITLENDDTTLTVLFAANIHFSWSERSKE